MSKISACLIVRDAELTLEPCLLSLRPHVDEIVIVDTGSTDSSAAIGQKHADKWERYTGCNRNPLTGQEEDNIWDFADARNRSFALASHDWAFWADADDVIEGAQTLRGAAANAPPGPFAYLIPYEYSYDGAGRPTCIHWRERLIRNPHDMVWTTPCHEVCVAKTGGMAHDQLHSVLIKHRAQWAAAQPGAKAREPRRNLRILEAYLRRNGEGDPRAMYYCGVEYARHGEFGKARQMLRRYTEISGWSDEKCLALLELGRILLQEGDCEEAVEWASRALMTKSWPDPYWLIAKCFWRLAIDGKDADHDYNLRRSYEWAKRGRPLEDAQTVLFYNPTERFETERIVNRISAHFGDIDEAAESCRRGLGGMPGDPELMDQLRLYEGVRIGREMDTLLARLVHLGRITPETSEAIQGLASGKLQLPPAQPANDAAPVGGSVGTGQHVEEAGLPAVPDGKLDIVIFTGPAMEPWNPATIEQTGMGGSETMAWEMARGLAALGHRVRHYGQCTPEQEGVFDGVHWFDSTRYGSVHCDVLVISRYAGALGCPGIAAKVRLLWVHDVHCGSALTHELSLQFDRVLCLSEWHKGYVCQVYPYLDPSRVIVTRNGIDLSQFDNPYVFGPAEGDEIAKSCDGTPSIQRNPHRAVYSSSPDRGLQTALELWPLIRAEVPDAELHVFYGFANLRKGRPADVALADKLEAACKATEGVVLHGRVPPRELAREFLKSGVWFYPTWFSETSCITAMQAQAAGLRIVTSPIAALNETVSTSGMLIAGAPTPIDMAKSFECGPCSDEYKSDMVAAVVLNLKEEPLSAPFPPGGLEKLKKKYPGEPIQNLYARQFPVWDNQECAKRFSLTTLCSDWSAMLESLVASTALEVVPPFYVAPEFEKAARGVDESEAA